MRQQSVPRSARAFTLVEVLIASGVAVGVFSAVALFMSIFRSASTDAGTLIVEDRDSAATASISLAPNDTVHAMARAVRIELQNDLVSARLIMAVPGIITPGWPDADGVSLAILRAPTTAFRTPETFKAQLLAPVDVEGRALTDAEVPFTTRTGFSILVLDASMAIRSVTRVSWSEAFIDSEQYRLYEVQRTPRAGPPVSYAFAERVSAMQAEPGYVFTATATGGDFVISFPDPSLDLLNVYSRLAAQITDSGQLASAKASVSRNSRVTLYAPSLP